MGHWIRGALSHLTYPGVYEIRHVASGRSYVGSAVNVYRRLREHKSQLSRGGHTVRSLQEDWSRDGERAFAIGVVEKIHDESLLREAEQRHLESREGSLYNAAAHVTPIVITGVSEEARRKISEKAMGNQRGKGHHYHGVLTEADILEIFRRYASLESTTSIADHFSVSSATVRRVVSRKIWWNTPIPPDLEEKARYRHKHRYMQPGTPKNKVTPDLIRRVKEMRASGMKFADISREVGVCFDVASRIASGKYRFREAYEGWSCDQDTTIRQ